MEHNEYSFETEDGLSLYAQAWKPDEGYKSVVCLSHGLGEHSERYAYVAGFLTADGYLVAAFDLRGHGKSPGKRGHAPSFDILLDDMACFLVDASERYPGKPIFLYGHSLGANLMMKYTLTSQSQLAGVVSTSPSLRLAFEPPAWKLSLGKILYALAPGFTMTNELERKALSRDPEVVIAYENDPLVHDRVSARLALDIFASGEWLLVNAARLQVPLLLVHGSADRLTSAQASQEFARLAGPRCTLKIWDGFYHETHNEPEKEQVLTFMRDWLNTRLDAFS